MALEHSSSTPPHHAIDFETVGSSYFQERELKKGAAGWVLLVGLGVAYVISGDYAGWNFGLAQGGWGGLFIATLLMATMYLCMCFSLAELSSMVPTAGGGYGFARTAFGPLGGFLTGTAILIEYAIAPAAIAVFIGAYCESLFGIGGWMIYLAFYIVFIGIHIFGVGEALKLMFIITAVAALALAVFIVAMVPHFSVDKLLDIAPTTAAGASNFLPYGYVGIWAAIPTRSGSSSPSKACRWPPRKPEPAARHAPRADRRHADPGRLRRADLAGRPWRRRLQHPGGIRQPAGGSADHGLRLVHLDERLRQPGRPGRADRQLLLDHLRLLAARSLPCRGPATCRATSR